MQRDPGGSRSTSPLPAGSSVRERYGRLLASGSSERMLLFSDAVFAIAMTLLVLELRVPDVEPAQLAVALAALLPSYLTFALSFAVIATVWMSHHRKFQVIARTDQTLMRLNLLLLLLVASLPFPTGVLGRYGDQAIAVVVYAAAATLVGFALNAVWLYAWRRGLLAPEVDDRLARYVLVRSLPIPLTFLLSIPVALGFGPEPAEYLWIVAFPALVLVSRAAGRDRRPRMPRRTPGAAPARREDRP